MGRKVEILFQWNAQRKLLTVEVICLFLQQADDGGQRARQTAAHDGQFQVAITSGHHDEDFHSESDEGSTSH